MKILFLDIDGVLNSHQVRYRDQSHRRDRGLVVTLNEIIESTGARVVLSSDWRSFYGWRECVRILEAFGFRGEIVDATPEADLPDLGSYEDELSVEFCEHLRRLEIEACLRANPVERYVVLDDLQVFPSDRSFMVCTDGDVGLSSKDAMRAVRALAARSAESAHRG